MRLATIGNVMVEYGEILHAHETSTTLILCSLEIILHGNKFTALCNNIDNNNNMRICKAIQK